MKPQTRGILKVTLGAGLLFTSVPLALWAIFARGILPRVPLPGELFALIVALMFVLAVYLLYSGIGDVDL
ncbi:hypothetical protein ES707_09931 [subsurface metagenome]